MKTNNNICDICVAADILKYRCAMREGLIFKESYRIVSLIKFMATEI